MAFNARLPVLLGASPFYRIPNSPIAHGLTLTEEDYVKARLTALAIETKNFSRDEIYTLLVTTRIINFLKGLPVCLATSLMTLVDEFAENSKTAIGLHLLKQLLTTGRLYFWTKRDLVENRKFAAELFFRVLAKAQFIAGQNGRMIVIDDFPGRHDATAAAL